LLKIMKAMEGTFLCEPAPDVTVEGEVYKARYLTPELARDMAARLIALAKQCPEDRDGICIRLTAMEGNASIHVDLKRYDDAYIQHVKRRARMRTEPRQVQIMLSSRRS
jgi:hypothetical protein